MEELKFKYWKDGNLWIGYLELFQDYMTQGESTEDLYKDLTGGELPDPVKQGILKIA